MKCLAVPKVVGRRLLETEKCQNRSQGACRQCKHMRTGYTLVITNVPAVRTAAMLGDQAWKKSKTTNTHEQVPLLKLTSQ